MNCGITLVSESVLDYVIAVIFAERFFIVSILVSTEGFSVNADQHCDTRTPKPIGTTSADIPIKDSGHRCPDLPGSGAQAVRDSVAAVGKGGMTRQPTGTEGDKCQMLWVWDFCYSSRDGF